MNPANQIRAFIAALFLIALGLGQPAQAANNVRNPGDMRGKYSGASMSCLVANDFYAVHFSAMQVGRQKEENNDFVKYCREIPKVGVTYLTIDLLDRDVRSLPIKLKVIEEEIGADGSPRLVKTLTEVPPRVYKNGTLDTKVEFTTPGHYALVAEIGDEMLTEDDRLRIPFSVALPSVQPTPWLKYAAWLASAVVFLFIGYMVYGFYRRYWPNLIGKSASTNG
jgi:hypothetical protein